MYETASLNEEALGPFECRLELSPDGAVRVVVSGELDMATAPALGRALQPAHAGRRPIVLDLSGVSFCDSTGLEVVGRAHRRARDEGRRLVIVRLPEQGQRLFALTGLDAQLEIADDRVTATQEPRDPKLVASQAQRPASRRPQALNPTVNSDSRRALAT